MTPSFNDMPDESLMDFIHAGEHPAFAALLERHHRRFYYAAYRWLLNVEDAEEVVQEAFLKLWSGKAKWKRGKGAKFTTWFYTIVYHQAIDRLRSHKGGHAELNEALVASGDNQEMDAAQRQQQRALHEALTELPDMQRIALQLFYFEALKQKDIASIMGLNIKALESHITRGKQALRRQLAPLKSAGSMEDRYVVL